MLLAVAEHKDIHSELIPRLATGFCSGIARTGDMCGAVSGGIMAIGLYLGRTTPADNIDRCFEAVHTFLDEFAAKHHALNCMDLIEVNLATAEGQKAYSETGKDADCTNFVGEATTLVMEIVEPKS